MKISNSIYDVGNRRELKRSVTRWDWALLALLVLLSAFSFHAFRLMKPQASDVWIIANGRPVGFYPLDENRVIRVKGPLGTTVIKIHKGQAAITQAPCAHKFCQKMGPIPAHGDVMICIPNRIVVEIKGRKGRETDAITR